MIWNWHATQSRGLVASDGYTHPLLEPSELTRSQRVGLANNRNDIDTGRESAHQFDVHFPEADDHVR